MLVDELDKIVFVVEASSNEDLYLYERFAEGKHVCNLTFETVGKGVHLPRGKRGKKRPVVFSLRVGMVYDKPVLFWHATSELVDYKMIDEWLLKNLPHLTKREHTDATNFHTCIHHVKQLTTK